MTVQEKCRSFVPWYCYQTSGRVFGFAPADYIPGCPEALDAMAACEKSNLFAGPTVPEGGYTGPAVVRTNPDGTRETGQQVVDRQIAESKAKQNQSILDFFALLPDRTGDGPNGAPELNFMLVLALVIVIGGLLLAQR